MNILNIWEKKIKKQYLNQETALVKKKKEKFLVKKLVNKLMNQHVSIPDVDHIFW